MSTTGELLSRARQTLQNAGIPSPYTEALILLEHVTGRDRSRLLAFPEERVSPDQTEEFVQHLMRRASREPLAYILGYREFMGLRLKVGPGVLVPRPETELMVELLALGLCHGGVSLPDDVDADDRPDIVTDGTNETGSDRRELCSGYILPHGARVVDVGTGSGAIALALKHLRPDLSVMGTDASSRALSWAQINRENLGLDVELFRANLLQTLHGPFDAVVSNPPYVAEGDPVDPETHCEPQEALYAGEDGLDVIRTLLPQSAAVLRAGGILVIEMDPQQFPVVTRLFRRHEFTDIVWIRDLAGRNRIIAGVYSPKSAC